MRFAAGPATETEGGSLVRVLVADDDPVTLHLVSETVKRFGYDVVTATDGLEAQRKFAEGGFPLVITDWDMPGPDGVELCRQIRNAALPSYTYIIFLTSRQKKHDLIEALSAGADDFISKPFHPQELKVRLRAAERILSLESDLREVNRDLAVLNRRLMETSRVDPLMEIGNRLDFEEKISEYHFQAVRHRETYGVVMCDVDHFKSFNDTFGHQYGDRVLQTVAAAVRANLRSADAAFRYGGEEILLFLGNQNLAGAVGGAERVRQCVEREEIAAGSAGEVRRLDHQLRRRLLPAGPKLLSRLAGYRGMRRQSPLRSQGRGPQLRGGGMSGLCGHPAVPAGREHPATVPTRGSVDEPAAHP